MRMLLFAGLLCVTGCCHRRAVCSGPKPVVKWSAETGVGTSYYPHAPCKKYEYEIEKVDISFKLRREW